MVNNCIVWFIFCGLLSVQFVYNLDAMMFVYLLWFAWCAVCLKSNMCRIRSVKSEERKRDEAEFEMGNVAGGRWENEKMSIFGAELRQSRG